jgi:hypothetical protein
MFQKFNFTLRYFYTHTNVNENVQFCPSTLAILQKRTLRDIFCDNLNLDSLQANVFKMPDDISNPDISCSEFNRFGAKELCLFGADLIPVNQQLPQNEG